MKVLVVASYDRSLISFRGELLEEIVRNGHAVVACAPDLSEDVRTSLALRGVGSRDLRMSRTGLNPLADLATLTALIRLIRSEHPDRILAYTVKAVLYTSIAVSLLRRRHLYSMITGLGYAFSDGGGRKRQIVAAIVQALYRLTRNGHECLFFQNPDDLAEFEVRGLTGRRTRTVLINGSGVNTAHYSIVPLSVTPTFLLIARLVAEKGILQYVDAAREVRRSHPDARFLLAGWIDPTPDAIPESQLRSWIEEGVIEYLGALEDVRPALADCRVYVLPSFREGTPRTVLEAMSMGRPIITTDAPGCRDTVEDGVNGLLVRPRDSQGLAQAMLRMIETPDLAESMGREGRRIAEDKYDVHKVNQVILDCMGLSQGEFEDQPLKPASPPAEPSPR